MMQRSKLSAQSQPAPSNPSVRGTLNGPLAIPQMRIRIYPGVAYYDTMHILVTADGAPIIADQSGNFGQLYTAGNGRY